MPFGDNEQGDSARAGLGDPSSLAQAGWIDPGVARPSEVDDRQEMMASAERSTCRSEAIVTGGGQVAIAEHSHLRHLISPGRLTCCDAG
jgi:hypothetical protein